MGFSNGQGPLCKEDTAGMRAARFAWGGPYRRIGLVSARYYSFFLFFFFYQD
jgi:hypothetical protein